MWTHSCASIDVDVEEEEEDNKEEEEEDDKEEEEEEDDDEESTTDCVSSGQLTAWISSLYLSASPLSAVIESGFSGRIFKSASTRSSRLLISVSISSSSDDVNKSPGRESNSEDAALNKERSCTASARERIETRCNSSGERPEKWEEEEEEEEVVSSAKAAAISSMSFWTDDMIASAEDEGNDEMTFAFSLIFYDTVSFFVTDI